MLLRAYSLSVALLAAILVSSVYPTVPIPHVELVVVLGTLAFLSEFLAYRLPNGGTVSMAFPIHYSAVLLGGPLAGAAVAVFGAVSPQEFASRKPPSVMLFNLAQQVLAPTVGGLAYLALGGIPLYQAELGSLVLTTWIVAALLAAPIQALTNILLVGSAMVLSSRGSVSEVWSLFRGYIKSLVALTLFGLVFAQLVAIAGLPALLLVVIPFLVARQTFRVYQQQEDAYLDTVKSMVAALEAKDPYTHGHSERVARYAAVIAAGMDMTHSELRRIEWAALLHDIGKVALKTDILVKADSLTAEEYAEVRAHPDNAVKMLADVEILDDVIPLIHAHHERIDGTGYPRGLSGADIPLGSRVLAVADCMDAMTSNRAYRPALGVDVALSELEAVAGTQLDSDCVRVLTTALRRGELNHLIDGNRQRATGGGS